MSGTTRVFLPDDLADVDQDEANRLMLAFMRSASASGATRKTVMWALAMLQADMLARCPLGEPQMELAHAFSAMVQAALPLATLAVERDERRTIGGKVAFDG